MDVQVAVLEIQRHLQTFTLNRGQQRRVDVEIYRVAKLVTFAGSGCFDASRKISRIVTSSGAFTKTAEQVSQSFVAEKVETFFGYFEMDVAWQWFRDFAVSAITLSLLLRSLFWLLA